MINKSHFILYVDDQIKSADFYRRLLSKVPILDVPGMTEFELTESSILGLMPLNGIKLLLKDKINISNLSEKEVKAELYILVDSLKEYLQIIELQNIPILSQVENRDWGDRVIYVQDPDNYVIAIGERIIEK